MVPLSTRTLAALSALVLATCLPAATAATDAEDKTSLVTFYGHVFGHGRDTPMPMNTQFPYGEADYSIGETAHACGLPGIETCEDNTRNELWLYTTAGFVQVKERTQFAYDSLHNERGLTKDTKLDTSQDITATLYMSADAHGWLLLFADPGAPHDVPWPVPGWNWDPGYLAQWQVEATVYTGILGEHGGAAQEAPDIAAALAEGKLTILAQGVSAPQDVQSLEAAGQSTVWKFDVDLGPPQRPEIKKEESYVVRFQWHGIKPDGSRAVIPQTETWNLNAGEYYPASITLPVKGAFNVELVLPQFVYDKLVILGIMNTPWGSYDVDQDSIVLEVKDANNNKVVPRHLARLADFSVAHDGHYKPVNMTYVWDYRADGLAPGDYTVTVSASNYQGSASGSCTGGFTILPDGNGGDIKIGECGFRTISDDQLETIKEGSAGDASGTGRDARLPLPVSLQSASAASVATLTTMHLAMAALGAVLVLRRWAK